jgi:hypothetical protein
MHNNPAERKHSKTSGNACKKGRRNKEKRRKMHKKNMQKSADPNEKYRGERLEKPAASPPSARV